MSKRQDIVCGVPQGSLLGPLLFILYINDLHECSNDLNFILFADDTNAFMKGTDIDNTIDCLNDELAKVAKWFDANQLSLNVKKTNYMIFSNRTLNRTKSVHIKGEKLEQVFFTKFLGVIRDCKLTWKEHIMYLKNKISKCIGILRKVNRIFSSTLKMKLYKTFIQPQLMYCNMVWCAAFQTVLRPLEVVQKKALKMALNKPKDTSTELVFQLAKVHDLKTIHKI